MFDKKAWKDLFSFIIEGPVESGIEQQGHKLLAQAGDKKLEDFKSYYHVNAKFDFLVRSLSLSFSLYFFTLFSFMKNALSPTSHPLVCLNYNRLQRPFSLSHLW